MFTASRPARRRTYAYSIFGLYFNTFYTPEFYRHVCVMSILIFCKHFYQKHLQKTFGNIRCYTMPTSDKEIVKKIVYFNLSKNIGVFDLRLFDFPGFFEKTEMRVGGPGNSIFPVKINIIFFDRKKGWLFYSIAPKKISAISWSKVFNTLYSTRANFLLFCST